MIFPGEKKNERALCSCWRASLDKVASLGKTSMFHKLVVSSACNQRNILAHTMRDIRERTRCLPKITLLATVASFDWFFSRITETKLYWHWKLPPDQYFTMVFHLVWARCHMCVVRQMFLPSCHRLDGGTLFIFCPDHPPLCREPVHIHDDAYSAMICLTTYILRSIYSEQTGVRY